MSEWTECTIADLVEINRATYSPKEGWPFVNYLDTGSVTENNIEQIQYLDVATDKVPSRARRKAVPGSIVYSTVRPNQRHYALIKSVPENFLVSTGFAVLDVKPDVADERFVYSYLTQQGVVDKLQSIAEQGVCTYPALNPDDIGALTIRIPSLPTQRKIAAVLGALDDKIELNRKMNANLEAMAQALFKSWFVDFEPFGGTMPEGWRVGKLNEIATYSTERVSIDDAQGDYYSTEGMKANKQGVEPSAFPESGNIVRVHKGQVLVSNIRPYFKKIFQAISECTCSTDVLCFVPKSDAWSCFLYRALWDDAFFAYVMSGAKGTKMPRGDKAQIMQYEIVLPDENDLVRFSERVGPLCGKITANDMQSRTLAQLRDALLPKLMSGELDVDEVKVEG